MDKQEIIFLDFYKEENDIWFIDYLSGILCTYNLKAETISLITELPVSYEFEQYRSLYIANGKVYLPPLFAKDLIIYDINLKHIKKISLSKYTKCYKPNFIEIYEYKNFLFCIPMSARGILRINTLNDEINVFDGFFKYINVPKETDRPIFRRSGLFKETIYLATCNGNKLISFNMLTCNFTLTNIMDDKNDGYSSCCCGESEIALISYDGSNAIILDKHMNTTDILDLKDKDRYALDLVTENIVIHIGCRGNGKAKVINLKNKTLEIISLDTGKKKTDIAKYYPENSFTFFAKIIHEKIWLYSTGRNSVCIFDLAGNKLKEYQFNIMSEDVYKIIKRKGERFRQSISVDNKLMYHEDYINNLNVFIAAITK